MKLGSMSVVENLFRMVSLGLVFNYSCIWWAIAFWLACRYAREDTHYLLYLHDLLKVQLASASPDKNDAILQVFVCLWVHLLQIQMNKICLWAEIMNLVCIIVMAHVSIHLPWLSSHFTSMDTRVVILCSIPFLMFPWSFWKPKMLEPEVWHPWSQFKIPLN